MNRQTTKILLLSLLTATTLAACNPFAKKEAAQPVETKNEVTSVTTAQSSSSSESQASQPIDTTTPFLNESFDSNAQYKKTAVPEGIDMTELNTAINDYYRQNFNESEKQINFTPVTKEALQKLQQSLAADTNLAKLKAKVDQMTIQLDNKTNYVVRVVVPTTHAKANQQVSDSEIQLLTHTLAQIGNRLVLIGYYDQATQSVVPVSLSNNSDPLFYNGE